MEGYVYSGFGFRIIPVDKLVHLFARLESTLKAIDDVFRLPAIDTIAVVYLNTHHHLSVVTVGTCSAVLGPAPLEPQRQACNIGCRLWNLASMQTSKLGIKS